MGKYRYFEVSEFDDPTEKGSGSRMQHEFVCALDELRGQCGFAFKINSGFRTIERNEDVGGAKNSAHLLGRAADIALTDGKHLFEVLEKALASGKFTGIGVRNRDGVCYIHLDNVRPNEFENIKRPAVWSY